MPIYLTNWSSKGLRGPGRALTIMARPRTWERGAGAVEALVPSFVMLRAVQRGGLGMAAYRADYVAQVGRRALGPGELCAGDDQVEDGDTLLCSCSREAAARGECHRVWAAELLRRAGWTVVLDGRELAGVTAEWAPVWAC